MKRPISGDNINEVGNTTGSGEDLKETKKSKIDGGGASKEAQDVMMDENLLYEVLNRADAQTLARAACVSKLWNRAAQDDRIWELMCIKDGSHSQQQQKQLRAVVVPLGGFRRLYSLHLGPLGNLSSTPLTSPSSTWPCLRVPPLPSPAKSAPKKRRLGKDEMNLSLSLLSIRYFANMNFNYENKGS
ncbi:unnamed protein product [Cuscuta europaea]|uniref:F-box domain-containing protein n=1 Tax=Cuscuta europaea TaxID=41803 RepID=A0A9P1EAN7_CUSEU|nr:unnamed protein product [Cuscuta europaea]